MDGAGGGANLGPEGAEIDPAVVEGRGDGRRDGEGNAGGNPAGRSDLAVVGEHLPAPVGPALGEEVRFAWGADPICRRFRGDGHDGIEGEGGASTNPVCDEQVGFGAASGEDADGGSAAREGEFRVSGVHDPQEAKYFAESTGILHAPLAVTEGQ